MCVCGVVETVGFCNFLSAKATEPSDLDLRNLEEDVGDKSEFSFVWFSGS